MVASSLISLLPARQSQSLPSKPHSKASTSLHPHQISMMSKPHRHNSEASCYSSKVFTFVVIKLGRISPPCGACRFCAGYLATQSLPHKGPQSQASLILCRRPEASKPWRQFQGEQRSCGSRPDLTNASCVQGISFCFMWNLPIGFHEGHVDGDSYRSSLSPLGSSVLCRRVVPNRSTNTRKWIQSFRSFDQGHADRWGLCALRAMHKEMCTSEKIWEWARPFWAVHVCVSIKI